MNYSSSSDELEMTINKDKRQPLNKAKSVFDEDKFSGINTNPSMFRETSEFKENFYRA